MKLRRLAIPAASVLSFVTVWAAGAQTPAQGPSDVLFCRGPLSTFRTDGGKTIRTPFKWAKEAATKANPGAGECAWADRAPEPAEMKTGPDNNITGNLGPFDNLPVGTVGKFCVYKANDVLMVRGVVRGTGPTAPFVEPPFTAGGCPS